MKQFQFNHALYKLLLNEARPSPGSSRKSANDDDQEIEFLSGDSEGKAGGEGRRASQAPRPGRDLEISNVTNLEIRKSEPQEGKEAEPDLDLALS